MCCSATMFENGGPVWSLSHDSSKGVMHLQTDGQLPKDFADIREKLFGEQDSDGGPVSDTDYIFDIPVELAAAVTGYRHDRSDLDWGKPQFTEVEPIAATS